MLPFFKKKQQPPETTPAAPVTAEASAPVAGTSPAPAPPMTDFAGRKVVVFGWGGSGRSATRLLAREGATVTAIDNRAESLQADLADGVTLLPQLDDAALAETDLIVQSPGVPREHPTLVAALAQGIPVIAEVELASRFLSAPILAVTGTNGKSTVVTWAGQILSSWKDHVFVGGNLGTPLSEAVLSDTPWDLLVVELSSFQLEGLTSLAPQIGVLLNASPDHLDRYSKVGDYYKAKFQLFAHMSTGYALLNAADETTPLVLEHYLHGAVPLTFNRPADGSDGVRMEEGILTVTTGGNTHPIVPVAELGIHGAHNIENAQATAAICLLAGCPLPVVAEGLRNFSGLPHRMQTVGKVNGVTYIDDSKATNPGAVVKAVEGIDGPLTLLLGGRDKGGDLFTLREPVFLKAERVVVFGESAGRFRMVLQGHPQVIEAETLAEAVTVAHTHAEPGETVLLSPACASFDEFSGFAARGLAFAKAVEALT